ncbi:MAG: DNA mismatch repair protein MutS, partial [Pyrinomonadaceae bacterium]
MTTQGTPLRKQYLDIKRRHPDAILLFRIGDFYEAFDDDARVLSRELGIVLTSKPMGKSFRVPLAGVPQHSLERHLATLISRGHRVAICEQLSAEPVKGGAGRGLIERDVVRVVTPGTIIEPGLLQSKVNNYLAALATDGKRAGIAYADVTTGEFAATEIEASAAVPELQRIAPAEILIPFKLDAKDDDLPGFITRRGDEEFSPQHARSVLLKHFGARTLAPFRLANAPLATAAAGALVSYLNDTQPASAGQITRLTSYHTGNFMLLDAQTLKSLEVVESFGGAPSLLATLDATRTAMGGRRLRRWLKHPLLDIAEITRRHEHVAWFKENDKSRAEAFAALELAHDLERLSGRVRAGLATAAEVLALGQGIATIPRVRAVLQQDAKKFGSLLAALPACEGVLQTIRDAINDELPRRGGMVGVIRDGYSDELDKLHELLRNGRGYLAELEQRERARTGIKSLRVGYNKVFGHFIEVTRPNLHLVPDGYTRKQTLTSAERFVTLELKEHESLVTNAQERIAELETSLFRQVCAEIGKRRDEILAASSTLAYLDAIASFAESAARHDYTRPTLFDSAILRINAGRHPVLERLAPAGEFVANDCTLGGDGAPEIALITGPNMSGKSTYLRQTALIVLLAQAGSFVPARAAAVGLCDRIFTRIGLYDRLGSGESTFMTEMIETAQILHHATPRSLILLDELGRGTSTYDGLAVARAVLEYVHNHPQLRAKTLFATHYHELTELAAVLP